MVLLTPGTADHPGSRPLQYHSRSFETISVIQTSSEIGLTPSGRSGARQAPLQQPTNRLMIPPFWMMPPLLLHCRGSSPMSHPLDLRRGSNHPRRCRADGTHMHLREYTIVCHPERTQRLVDSC